MTFAAKSSGRAAASAPPYFPMGVLRASRMYTDFIAYIIGPYSSVSVTVVCGIKRSNEINLTSNSLVLQLLRGLYGPENTRQVKPTRICGKEFKLYFWRSLSSALSQLFFFR